MKNIWAAALALGIVASVPKHQSHNLMKLPSFQGIVQVRASIPGRMRLYMPTVTENITRAAQMKTQLESTGAIDEVTIEPRTGSVLIRYDETKVEAAVVEGAAIKLMGLDERINQAPSSRMEEGMKALWNAINQGVLNATGGWLDARMFAGTAMTIAGMYSFMKNGISMPGTMTLLWWASRLFGGDGHA